MTVDLRHFRSFVVVAEEGNIGRAAGRLYITQPALSRQLQQLEEHLGVVLFTRVPRGVELTAAGRELLGKARVALDAAEQALTIGRPAQLSGRLVVGVAVGHRDEWFALTEAFTGENPAVDIEIRNALSEPLQRQVVAGELDVAVVLEPHRQPGLTYHRLRDEPIAAWMHHEHPLAERASVAPAELDGLRITLIGGSAGRASGFNAAVRRVLEGVAVEFVEPPDLMPSNALKTADAMSLSVDVGFPRTVSRVELEGGHTMTYHVVHRADVGTAMVRAFAAFAARHAQGA